VNIARTLRPVAATVLAFLGLGAVALAATIPNGTKFIAVTHKGINSATLTPGTDFKLHVDDPSQPALAGALVVGHVTGVTGPGGMSRASISFVFDYIQFSNGKKQPIHAAVVSQNVTQTNTSQQRKEQVKFSLPPMPNGTVTPGPVAWQMHFRGGDTSPSITPGPGGGAGGVVYAQQANEQIVVPPGSPVTLQLTADLTTP
jgi:hypothetical protein